MRPNRSRLLTRTLLAPVPGPLRASEFDRSAFSFGCSELRRLRIFGGVGTAPVGSPSSRRAMNRDSKWPKRPSVAATLKDSDVTSGGLIAVEREYLWLTLEVFLVGYQAVSRTTEYN